MTQHRLLSIISKYYLIVYCMHMLGFRKNNSEKYKGGHEEWDFYHFFSSHNKSFTFSWYVSKCKIDHVRVENKYKMISAKCTRNQILEELDGDFTFCDRKLENFFYKLWSPKKPKCKQRTAC